MNDIQKCLDMLALYEDRIEKAGRLRDVLSVISVTQLPQIEKPPSFKRTCSRFEGNSNLAGSVEDKSSSQSNPGKLQSQFNLSNIASLNSSIESYPELSLPVTSNDLGGMPVHIDMDMDMVAPFNSLTYGSGNTAPDQGLDEMAYGFDPGQSMNRAYSSQNEWSQFMAEVDELLQLVDYPVVTMNYGYSESVM
ncbi:hypothetical protein GYMLUDRAFT_47747 [Collybiopsis luxurians FD-317 M1]|uniref:Uncharacterized protein n=1 Tax=Collybiopsis luxurians FD-317 M1 TaxID=944289 RepID=A0A0D0BLB7_9AGAR|nr:hypothetical protein GYMLUDRAFT_47747 [Collybiopsis luxurians FD-317 M1]